MRILLVLEHYYPNTGGVEVLFKTLSEGLVEKGHQVTVITSRLDETKANETINGVKVKRIPVPNFARRYFFSFFAIPKVISLARDFDIIHAGTYNGGLPVWFASNLRKKPSALTYHETMHDWGADVTAASSLGLKIIHLIENIIVRLNFDKFVCVSKSTQKGLLKLGLKKKRTQVIYNAMDYDTFDPKKYRGARAKIRKKLGVKSSEFLYVFYGRPGVSKGVEYLIKAIPDIAKRIPNSKGLFILGKEPKERFNEMRILLSKKANGNAILHKSVPYQELPEYLLAADAIVVPSLKEGFGYCVAESCALGIPVVASNTTSIPEVASGKFLLVPPRNSMAIAKALEYTKNKKYMKTPLKKFTVDRMVKEYEQLYCELIK